MDGRLQQVIIVSCPHCGKSLTDEEVLLTEVKIMKNDVIMSCKYIIKNTIFSVQASYCGHSISDSDVRDFEEKAYNLIVNSTDSDIEEAFDECVECCIEESEVTSTDVLRQIGDRAETIYESLTIESINVIKERKLDDSEILMLYADYCSRNLKGRTSGKKKLSSSENGKLGGRPKKEKEA